MNLKSILFGLLALLFLYSCNSEAKKSYEQLSSEVNALSGEMSISTLEELVSKIDNHIGRFPDFEENSLLEESKKGILSIIENKVYEQLVDNVNQLQYSSFQDYESAIQGYNSAKQSLTEYLNRATNQDNIANAQNLINQIDNQLSSISLEQNDFYSAVNSNSVYTIEEFLSNYPNSVMRNSLYGKIDEIYYSEFLNDFISNPSTINELNNSSNKAKSYLSKFRSVEAKSKINELIVGLESQRRSILDSELSDNLQVLIERMEEAAKQRAERAHSTYTVEMCSARGSIPEVVGNSSTFERVYQVNLKGAFFGIDKREMMIAVSGRIKGDLQNGVTITITGSRVESDKKL